jgi:hypothetical protein
MADNVTKKMLETLRRGRVEQAKWAAEQFIDESVVDERDNFLTRSKILMQEAVDDKKKVLTEEEQVDDEHSNSFDIDKDTPQFGDLRTSQEEAIRKTLNTNVQFEGNALKYYPKADDMTLDGKIPSLNLKFQFRYNEPSGQGCFVWADALQLTNENVRTVGKINDAFNNWKDSITNEPDLMNKLKKASENTD